MRRVPTQIVDLRTGELRPASCGSHQCPACVISNARRSAVAIGRSRPTVAVLLTDVSSDWGDVRDSMKSFRRNMNRKVAGWQDCYHVERNPSGVGNHIHAWAWSASGSLTRDVVRDAAARADMGWADVQPRRAPEGASLSYGLKAVLQGDPTAALLPPATADFLSINGGRLLHATRGFWRDGRGNAISGLHEAIGRRRSA